MNIADILHQSKLIVIKIGTALVVDESGTGVRSAWLSALAQDVQALLKAGKNVVIVSSGGIALGRPALGISPKTAPQAIPLEHKQAASAVGQFHVFQGYHNAFAALDIRTGQVLLTMSETENRRMHLNARATLQVLLDKGIVPVINENDTISTEEIRFGDNDRLSVRVAQMIGADAVLVLSTVDGLYSANPSKDPDAEHLPLVGTITDEHMKMAGEAAPGLSTGGMRSKLEAARTAMRAGISLVIADGRADHALRDLPQAHCTLFPAAHTGDSRRKKWIGAHMAPKGAVTIDEGALAALRNGKSLLPVGVRAVAGRFERGDAIHILAPDGRPVAVGLSAYASNSVKTLMGRNTKWIHTFQGYAGRDELVHRNDMALLETSPRSAAEDAMLKNLTKGE